MDIPHRSYNFGGKPRIMVHREWLYIKIVIQLGNFRLSLSNEKTPHGSSPDYHYYANDTSLFLEPRFQSVIKVL